MSSGEAEFKYRGHKVSNDTSGDVYEIRNGSKATVVIRDRAFHYFTNSEGKCAGLYQYLFLFNGG